MQILSNVPEEHDFKLSQTDAGNGCVFSAFLLAFEETSYTVGPWIEKGLFRPKTETGFLGQSKNFLFDPTYCNTFLFSACRGSRKKLLYRPARPVKFAASPIPPIKRHTRPHVHTTQEYPTAAPTLAWLFYYISLLLLHAASRRGTSLYLPTGSVCHTMAAARNIDDILPTTAAPAVILAALG